MNFDLSMKHPSLDAFEQAKRLDKHVGMIFKHKADTGPMKEYTRLCEAYVHGDGYHHLNYEWKLRNKIEMIDPDKFYEAVKDTLVYFCQFHHEPMQLPIFMYNPYSGISTFLLYYQRLQYREEVEHIQGVVGCAAPLMQLLSVQAWYKEHAVYVANANPGTWEMSPMHDLDVFLQYYNKQCGHWTVCSYNSPAWWEFVEHMKNEYHVDLLKNCKDVVDTMPLSAYDYPHKTIRNPQGLFKIKEELND